MPSFLLRRDDTISMYHTPALGVCSIPDILVSIGRILTASSSSNVDCKETQGLRGHNPIHGRPLAHAREGQVAGKNIPHVKSH